MNRIFIESISFVTSSYDIHGPRGMLNFGFSPTAALPHPECMLDSTIMQVTAALARRRWRAPAPAYAVAPSSADGRGTTAKESAAPQRDDDVRAL